MLTKKHRDLGNDTEMNDKKDKPIPFLARLGKRTHPVVIWIVMGVIIVIGAAIGIWVSNKDNATDTSSKTKPKESSQITHYNNLMASGRSDEVISSINNDKNIAQSRDGKMMLASAYLNAGKNDEALAVFTDAAKTYGWTENIAEQIALIYVAKGDKQNAITYYQKRIELLRTDSSNPMADTAIEQTENRIKELQ